MVLIDVHCHVDFYKDDEIEAIIERARKQNVRVIINNGVNPKANTRVLDLVKKYPEIKPALGLYPIDALKLSDEKINEQLKLIKNSACIAIGEVGLDFKESTDGQEHEKQIELFKKIISLSLEISKPLIVHSRKAESECIDILKSFKAEKVVMHCFSGNMKLIDRIIRNHWFLTIPASVQNSEHFQNVIARAPLENLFCETDSPFLHPLKERNNEPANILYSYKKIAEIKNLSLTKVEKIIEQNFNRLFNCSL